MFLKKAWSWVKNYWYVPLILVAAVVLAIFKQKDVIDWAIVLDKARNSHKDEVEIIQKTHEEEIVRREKVIMQARYAEQQVRERFAEDKKDLDARTEKRVKKIIKQLKDDPDAMAEKLREETGYHIIVVN